MHKTLKLLISSVLCSGSFKFNHSDSSGGSTSMTRHQPASYYVQSTARRLTTSPLSGRLRHVCIRLIDTYPLVHMSSKGYSNHLVCLLIVHSFCLLVNAWGLCHHSQRLNSYIAFIRHEYHLKLNRFFLVNAILSRKRQQNFDSLICPCSRCCFTTKA